MVTTRSTTRQSKLPGYSDKRPTTQSPKKRKASSPDPTSTPSSKKSSKTNRNSTSSGSTILINRSPVLQLWAASVAHLTHPDLAWSTCLSAGAAIATICAVAKGKSIGTIDDHRDSKPKQKRKADDDFERLQVMQFKLRTRGGLVYVGSGSDAKPKPGTEEMLKRKFGTRYGDVRRCFEEGLEGWRGEEGELMEGAFGMYERFRPTVEAGQKGWGRKGELSLDRVREVVMKS